MLKCKPLATNVPVELKLSCAEGHVLSNLTTYRQLFRAFMHVVSTVRPDIIVA